MCSPPHPSAPGRLAPSSRSPAHPPPQDEKQRCLDNGWEVDDPDELQRWRDQEPINAHSHLAAMLLRQPVDSAVLAVPQLSKACILACWSGTVQAPRCAVHSERAAKLLRPQWEAAARVCGPAEVADATASNTQARQQRDHPSVRR